MGMPPGCRSASEKACRNIWLIPQRSWRRWLASSESRLRRGRRRRKGEIEDELPDRSIIAEKFKNDENALRIYDDAMLVNGVFKIIL